MTPPVRSEDAVTLREATSADLPAVLALLTQAGLPVDGLATGVVALAVAEVNGRMAGVAGLERYGTSALLRSVAVHPNQQGQRVAARLVERLLEEARCACIHDVYLRTTTAEGYFPRFGFAPIDVAAVPDAIRRSAEFQGACPESALTMVCCLDDRSAG